MYHHNKIKNKIMWRLTDAERSLDKNQHPFTVKENLNKIGIEVLSQIDEKNLEKNPILTLFLMVGHWTMGNKARMFAPITPIRHHSGSHRQCKYKKKY